MPCTLFKVVLVKLNHSSGSWFSQIQCNTKNKKKEKEPRKVVVVHNIGIQYFNPSKTLNMLCFITFISCFLFLSLFSCHVYRLERRSSIERLAPGVQVQGHPGWKSLWSFYDMLNFWRPVNISSFISIVWLLQKI